MANTNYNEQDYKNLYTNMKNEGWNVGEYEQFKNRLQTDSQAVDNMYQNLKKSGWDVGDADAFRSRLYVPESHQTAVPSNYQGYNGQQVDLSRNQGTQSVADMGKQVWGKFDQKQQSVNDRFGKFQNPFEWRDQPLHQYEGSDKASEAAYNKYLARTKGQSYDDALAAARQAYKNGGNVRESLQQSFQGWDNPDEVNQHAYNILGGLASERIGQMANKYIAPLADKAISKFEQLAGKELKNQLEHTSSYYPDGSPNQYPAINAANEVNDPEKVKNYLVKTFQSIYNNPKMIAEMKSDAARFGYDYDTYLNQVVKPQINEQVGQIFHARQLDKFFDKNWVDYAIGGGIGNSIIGMLSSRAMETASQRAYKNEAEAMTEAGQNPYYKPSFASEIAKGTIPFAVDALTGGMALPNIASKGVTGAVARTQLQQFVKRYGAEAAYDMLKTSRANSVGFRIAEKIIQGAAGGAANLGVYNAESEAARQIRDREFSPSKLAERTGSGVAMGTALGFGQVSNVLTSGAKTVAGRVGAMSANFLVENGIFTGVGEAEKWMKGEGKNINFAQDFITSAGQLAALKMSGVVTNPRGTIRNFANALSGKTADDSGIKFTRAEKEFLNNTTASRDLMESLSKIKPSMRYLHGQDLELGSVPNGTKLRMNASTSAQQKKMMQLYDEVMTNPDAPYALRFKLAALYGAPLPANRPIATGYRIDNNVLRTIDANGQCVEERRFSSNAEANRWAKNFEKKIPQHAAEDFAEKNPDAAANIIQNVASDLGVSERVVADAITGKTENSSIVDRFNAYAGSGKMAAPVATDAEAQRWNRLDLRTAEESTIQGRQMPAEEGHRAYSEMSTAKRRIDARGDQFSADVTRATTDEQRNAALTNIEQTYGEEAAKDAVNYWNAASRYDGYSQSSQQRVQQHIDAESEKVNAIANKKSPESIITAEYNGRQVYVTDGRLKYDNNGNLMPGRSDMSVMVTDAETGETKAANALNLENVGFEATQDRINDAIQRITGAEEENQRYANGTPSEPQPGDQYVDSKGNRMQFDVKIDDQTGQQSIVKLPLDEQGNIHEEQAMPFDNADLQEYRQYKSDEIDGTAPSMESPQPQEVEQAAPNSSNNKPNVSAEVQQPKQTEKPAEAAAETAAQPGNSFSNIVGWNVETDGHFVPRHYDKNSNQIGETLSDHETERFTSLLKKVLVAAPDISHEQLLNTIKGPLGVSLHANEISYLYKAVDAYREGRISVDDVLSLFSNSTKEPAEKPVENNAPQAPQPRDYSNTNALPDGNVVKITMTKGEVVYLRGGDPNNIYGISDVTYFDRYGKLQKGKIRNSDIAEISEPEPYDSWLEHNPQAKASQLPEGMEEGKQFTIDMDGNQFKVTVYGVDNQGNIIVVDEQGEYGTFNRDELGRYKRAYDLKAEAARKEQERFDNGIAGLKETREGKEGAKIDYSNPKNDAKAVADYLVANSDKSSTLKSIEGEKEGLKQQEIQLNAKIEDAKRYIGTGDADMEQRANDIIEEAERELKDITARQKKWGEIRDAIFTNQEKTAFTSERMKAVNEQSRKVADELSKNQPEQPKADADGLVRIDGNVDITMGDSKAVEQYLLDNFATELDADNYVTDMRQSLASMLREEFGRPQAEANRILSEYYDGNRELTADEITSLIRQREEAKVGETAILEKMKVLQKLANRLPAVYKERTEAAYANDPDAQRKDMLEKATDKYKAAQKAYADRPELLDIVNRQEPETIEELVASTLRKGSINWEGIDRGEHHVRGLQEELGTDKKRGIGAGSDTNAFNYYLAPSGEGKGIDEIVHEIYEAQPSDSRYSDADIKNTLLDLLSSAQKPTDIRDMVINNRIKEAEDMLDAEAEAERRAAEDAEFEADNQPKDFKTRLESAISETNTNPTEEQKKAGNYKKGHISFGGYEFSVENPKGSTRSGKDADGKEWSQEMHNTYGYISKKYGVDGDHLDFFLNDDADLDNFNGKVYVIDQVDPKTGEFDEHKVMYGFPDRSSALKAYFSNYEKGWKGFGGVTGVEKAVFDKWLDQSDHKTKPFADYKIAKDNNLESWFEKLLEYDGKESRIANRRYSTWRNKGVSEYPERGEIAESNWSSKKYDAIHHLTDEQLNKAIEQLPSIDRPFEAESSLYNDLNMEKLYRDKLKEKSDKELISERDKIQNRLKFYEGTDTYEQGHRKEDDATDLIRVENELNNRKKEYNIFGKAEKAAEQMEERKVEQTLSDLSKASGAVVRLSTDADNMAETDTSFFDRDNNTIVVNRARSNEDRVKGWLGHESWHQVEYDEGAQDFADKLLVARYGSMEKAREEMDKIRNFYADHGRTISLAQARHEVVANIFRDNVFGGEDGAKRLEQAMNMASGNMTFAEKTAMRMRDLLDRTIERFHGDDKLAPSIKDLQKARDTFADLIKKNREWADAHPYEVVRQKGELLDNHGDTAAIVTNKHDIEANMETYLPWTDNLGQKHNGSRYEVLKYMKEHGHSPEEINKMAASMDYWYNYMRDLSSFTDADGNFLFNTLHEWNKKQPLYHYVGGEMEKAISSLVKNGEYPVNIELTTDCIKREAFTNLVNRMVEMNVDLTNMGPREITVIQDLMKQYGIQVACPLCFVEGKRLAIVHWAKTIADDWNDALRENGIDPDKVEPFHFGKDGDNFVPTEELAKLGSNDARGIAWREIANVYDLLTENGTLKHRSDIKKRNAEERAARLKEMQDEWAAANPDKDISEFELTKSQKTELNKIDKKGIELPNLIIKNSNEWAKKFSEMEKEWQDANPGTDKVFEPTQNQWRELNKIRNNKIKAIKKKMVRLIAMYPEMQHSMSMNDLLGSNGLMEIRQQNGNAFAELYSILLGRFGSGTPKPIQSAVPYASEVMLNVTEADMRKAKLIGGARMFSFSDFDITKTFDYLQAHWDLAAKGMKLQVYTKEVPFILMFGKTHDKINMSTLPLAVVSEETKQAYANAKNEKQRSEIRKAAAENAGLELDENGKIKDMLWSNEHSVSPEFCKDIFLDDNYNSDCGAITVGASVNHSIYAALQDWIRMVIPYHASGVTPAARERADTNWYTDQTPYQNTMVQNKAGKYVSISSPWAKKAGKKDFDFYKGEDKPGWDMRERCREYVKWCDKKGYLPRFWWGINSAKYREYCEKNHYTPNEELIKAMDANTTDGVWNGYYKFITDFNCYKPSIKVDENGKRYAKHDANGNLVETTAPHRPVEANFDLEKGMKDILFGGDKSMLANRERSIKNANSNEYQIAKQVKGYLDGSIPEEQLVGDRIDRFENRADEKLYSEMLANQGTPREYNIERTKPEPKQTQKVYKLMRLGDDGKLYPLFIDSSEPTELGKWYDAASPDLESLKKLDSGVYLVDDQTGEAISLEDYRAKNGGKASKNPSVNEIKDAAADNKRWVKIEDTARQQKRYGGESRKYWNIGINGTGSVSTFAMRPGWHAGSLPTMRQIGLGNGPEKYRDDRFVWVEGEISADKNYQEEANQNPDSDIPTHIPEDGYYMKATNANKAASQADRVGWYVAGAFKANRIMSDAEARSVIDEWNNSHPDKSVDYDWPRQSGNDFTPSSNVEYNIEPEDKDIRFMKGYHGSANDFDRFNTMEHLSEGEGNQSFGAGTYIADHKELAEKYADIAAGNANDEIEVYKKGLYISNLDADGIPEHDFVADLYSGMTPKEVIDERTERIRKNKDFLENTKNLPDELIDLTEDQIMKDESVLKYAQDHGKEYKVDLHQRNVYDVEIPDEKDGAKYLEWEDDVPRKDVITVKNELYNILKEGDYKGAEKELKRELDDAFKDVDGESLYGNVSAYLGSDKQASEMLNQLGYTGVKVHAAYHSNDPRFKDNYNYVIFNDNDIKITNHEKFRMGGDEIVGNDRVEDIEITARATAESLGGKKVNFVAPEDAPRAVVEADERGEQPKGWYDTRTGEVFVYTKNATSKRDVQHTIFHEKLGHEGLVALLGSQEEVDRFGSFVFFSADTKLQREIAAEADRQGFAPDDTLRLSKAAQEVFARIAEEGPRSAEEFSLWQKMKYYLIQAAKKMGIQFRGMFTDADMRYYVLKTGNALKRYEGMDVDMQKEIAEEGYKLYRKQDTYVDDKGGVHDLPGKPKKKANEGIMSFKSRMEEWEKKVAAYTDETDPIPADFDDNAPEVVEGWNNLLGEWKTRHGLTTDMPEGIPGRKEGQSDADWMTSLKEYEKWQKSMKDTEDPMPNYFTFIKEQQEQARQKYTEWAIRHQLMDEHTNDMKIFGNVAERDIVNGRIVDDKSHGIEQQKEGEEKEVDDMINSQIIQDMGDSLGLDTSPDGVKRMTKMAVIDRRKDVESIKAQSAIQIYDLSQRIDRAAKNMGIKAEVLRKQIPYMIEHDRRVKDLVEDINNSFTWIYGRLRNLSKLDIAEIEPMLDELRKIELNRADGEAFSDKEIEIAARIAKQLNIIHQERPDYAKMSEEQERKQQMRLDAVATALNSTKTFTEGHLQITADDLIENMGKIEQLRAKVNGLRDGIPTKEMQKIASEICQSINSRHAGDTSHAPLSNEDLMKVLPVITRATRVNQESEYVPYFSDDILSIAKVFSRQLGGTIQPTDEVKDILKDIRKWYDEYYGMMDDANLLNRTTGIVQNYVNHIWDKEASDPDAYKQFVDAASDNYQRISSQNAKQRMVSTYLDGIEYGLVPKFDDIIDIMKYYNTQNADAIGNKRFLDQLSGIVVNEKNSDGEVVLSLPLLSSVKPDLFNMDKYVTFKVPGIGLVYCYAGGGKMGSVNVGGKEIAMPILDQSGIGHLFGTIFGQTENAADSKLGKNFWSFFDKASGLQKKIELSLSGFHAGALTEVFLGQAVQFGPSKSMRAFSRYLLKPLFIDRELPSHLYPEDMKRAAQHLVKLGATDDYAASEVKSITGSLKKHVDKWIEEAKHQEGAIGAVKDAALTPVKVLTTLADMINKGMDRVLWDYIHDGLKMAAFKMYSEDIDKRLAAGEFDKEKHEQLLDEAGQYINDMFGGQWWECINISPVTIKHMRRALLSPDWLISTNRHFLGNFGFGSLYSESSWRNWVDYNTNNLKRAAGKTAKAAGVSTATTDEWANIPRDLNRAFRSKAAKLCYGIGVCVIFNAAYNAMNALMRKWDEDNEKEIAEERRKSDPTYKSPYELMYPNGMSWIDYTMMGNAAGKKTDLFMGPDLNNEQVITKLIGDNAAGKLWHDDIAPAMSHVGGRFKDNKEMYIRWGKQFREFPEMFMDNKGHFSFPGQLMNRMLAKANPSVRLMLDPTNGLFDFWSQSPDYENEKIKNKYGATIGALQKIKNNFLPFMVPTQQNKEFKAADFFFPSSKGYSSYKAQRDFKDAILEGSMDDILTIYKACQLNHIDAEKQLKAAIASVKADEDAELGDGISNYQQAKEAYDAASTIDQKKYLANKMQKYLLGENYPQYSIDELLEDSKNVLAGGALADKKSSDDYNMQRTSDDVREDTKLKYIRTLAKKHNDAWKQLLEDGDRQGAAEYKKSHAKWLQIYNISNTANSRINGASGLKKKVGKDKSAMDKIRKMRAEALQKIEKLNPTGFKEPKN